MVNYSNAEYSIDDEMGRTEAVSSAASSSISRSRGALTVQVDDREIESAERPQSRMMYLGSGMASPSPGLPGAKVNGDPFLTASLDDSKR